jgi:hypothetical protein
LLVRRDARREAEQDGERVGRVGIPARRRPKAEYVYRVSDEHQEDRRRFEASARNEFEPKEPIDEQRPEPPRRLVARSVFIPESIETFDSRPWIGPDPDVAHKTRQQCCPNEKADPKEKGGHRQASLGFEHCEDEGYH